MPQEGIEEREMILICYTGKPIHENMLTELNAFKQQKHGGIHNNNFLANGTML